MHTNIESSPSGTYKNIERCKSWSNCVSKKPADKKLTFQTPKTDIESDMSTENAA